jgi:hypothetical protein
VGQQYTKPLQPVRIHSKGSSATVHKNKKQDQYYALLSASSARDQRADTRWFGIRDNEALKL